MGVPLVIAVPTGRFRRDLRRFTFSGRGADCPAGGGHDATVTIGEVDEAEAERMHGDNWPHDDPRWPAACTACGAAFERCDCGQDRCPVEGEWQRNDNRLLALPDGTEFAWWGDVGKVAPVGTMVRCEWADECYPGRGESWAVVLPGGAQWMTTQDSIKGERWEVTGTPPLITVRPSIWCSPPHGWHGWITNGELVG